MAVLENITIEQGVEKSFKVTIKDNTGQPKDLTAYTAKSFIRKSDGTGDVLAEFEVVNTPLSNSGSIELKLTSEHSADLERGAYAYDVVLIQDDRIVMRPITGCVAVLATSTNTL